MTPERAKELIQEYADVNRKIKDTKSQIGSALDKCQGISAKESVVSAKTELASILRTVNQHMIQKVVSWTCT